MLTTHLPDHLTATSHPGNIAIAKPGDDDHGGGYPEIHPEPQPDHKPEPAPANQAPRPLTDSVKSSIYKNLTQAECIVLGMLDSCCPSPDSVSWFCPWSQLVKLASVAPAIADDRIMAAISNLREFKIIDVCVGTSNGEPGVFVARHQHRAMLLHNFMQHTITEKRKLVEQVTATATGSSAAA